MRRTKEEAEETRKSILDAAERLLLDRGVDAATLDAISRAAGVTRGAFYWHFKDKGDLLNALQARSSLPQQELLAYDTANIDADPFAFLETACIEALMIFENDSSSQHLFAILSSHTGRGKSAGWLDDANTELFKRVLRLTQSASDQRLLSPDFTAEEAAIVVMVTMNGLLGEWLRSGKVFPLQQFGSKLLRKQFAILGGSG